MKDRLTEAVGSLPQFHTGTGDYVDVESVLDVIEGSFATTPPSPAPAPSLDVNRMAEALNNTIATRGWLRSTPADPVEEWRMNARVLIAEYDRLAAATTPADAATSPTIAPYRQADPVIVDAATDEAER